MREFGMEDMTLFVAVLKLCPAGSVICFDRSEPDSFVHRFRKWSHRENSSTFEADYYRIDSDFIVAIEQAIDNQTLQLDHHLHIMDSDDRCIFQGVDDFYDIHIHESLRDRLQEHLKHREPAAREERPKAVPQP